MEIKPSRRAQGIKASPTLKIAAQAAERLRSGRQVLNLATGEPAFPAPPQVSAAAIAAIAAERDTSTATSTALEAAIIAKFERDNGLRFKPEHIAISGGSKHSLYTLMQALLDDDDEVIIPAPYWVSYPDMARLAGAEPVIVRTKARQHFKMTPEQLRGALGPRSRLLLLNNPCNPTGAVYAPSELGALAAVLLDFPEVVIASDDVYEHLSWAPQPLEHVLAVAPRLHERTVIVNGLSKAYSMPEWRIGYAAGPAGLIAAIKKIQSHSTSAPATVVQAAAVAALDSKRAGSAAHIATLRKQHDFLIAELRLIGGVEVLPAQGAFFLFPDMSAVIERFDSIDDDIELASWLLDETGVATVPGSAFGATGCLRLSYTPALDILREAVAKLRRVLG
ncbi:MAG: aminotransferase class I/II-fold pyridoxal phosphate-dependent enzyme [Gammaproteobacteria bacterium]